MAVLLNLSADAMPLEMLVNPDQLNTEYCLNPNPRTPTLTLILNPRGHSEDAIETSPHMQRLQSHDRILAR
eukprot:853135-Amorphochlora_amoeboformis.AAC.1